MALYRSDFLDHGDNVYAALHTPFSTYLNVARWVGQRGGGVQGYLNVLRCTLDSKRYSPSFDT